MAAVDISHVCKSYGAVETIRDVSVCVPDGSFTVLVGPSGCGKSTLLRMIAGLEEITDGTISIGGRVINEVEPKLRDVAMVFQNYALYPHMTVAENMGFSLRLARRPRAEIAARVGEAARILGLGDYLARYPRQLSGGQRQRVAMGRAIVRNPQVFLFDEPLSNLDAALRVQMRGELKDLHARLGTTTVYVTHDQIEAMTLADRIVVMRAGVIEQVGAPLDLYDRPANRFVAGFIGSPAMNFLPARISEDGGQALIDDGGRLDLDGRHAPGAAVTIGIRPEHAVIAPDGPLALTLATIEPTGAETHLAGHIGGTRCLVVTRERLAHRAGDVLRLAAPPPLCHVFDGATGRRLMPQAAR